MLKQVQSVAIRHSTKAKSSIGTKLLVECKSCHASFDQSYDVCPYCGWKFGDPIVNTEPLQDITDIDMTDENGQWFQTFTIGSAKHDLYCEERGGLYGVELVDFTIDMNNNEHLKLFNALNKLRDNQHCRYTIKLKG
jgi:hypothetical protein|tara:strand:- start:93 stop:503 length:411 start_codon:yes stop_codon:yes gene_type:complete